MKYSKVIIVIIGLVASFVLTGCASTEKFYHNSSVYGEIMEIKNNEITFYVGDQKNFKIGQELRVFKKEREKIVIQSGGRHSRENDSRIEIHETAVVKITGFVSDKYAQAVIIKGSLAKGDVIELDNFSHH